MSPADRAKGAFPGAPREGSAAHPPGEPAAQPAPDPWAILRRHTPARIALGRSGAALPTREVLAFSAAHAQARDAVHDALDAQALATALESDGWTVRTVRSRAASREVYLRRPDLGRRLDPVDRDALQSWAARRQAEGHPQPDLALVVADGLSALAARRHAQSVLASLREALGGSMVFAPVVIATQARVALADEVGEALGAALVLILLGERPGLSSPDSLGAYLTHGPRVGRHDAERNCVSNIRPEGLPAPLAARRIAWLLRSARRLGYTGVALKDDSERPLLEAEDPAPAIDGPGARPAVP